MGGAAASLSVINRTACGCNPAAFRSSASSPLGAASPPLPGVNVLRGKELEMSKLDKDRSGVPSSWEVENTKSRTRARLSVAWKRRCSFAPVGSVTRRFVVTPRCSAGSGCAPSRARARSTSDCASNSCERAIAA